MPDLGPYIETAGTIIASIGGAFIAVRYAKKGQDGQQAVDASGNQLTAEATFRQDILKRVTELEAALESQRVRFEAQSRDDHARYEAREDQLIEWGTWSTDPVPRRPPPFIWPIPTGPIPATGN